jgi:hypothetical protein
MKTSILHVFFCLLIISSNAFAQNGNEKVTVLKVKANATVSYQGNLAD